MVAPHQAQRQVWGTIRVAVPPAAEAFTGSLFSVTGDGLPEAGGRRLFVALYRRYFSVASFRISGIGSPASHSVTGPDPS